MWKRIDTPQKRNQIIERELYSLPQKPSLKDYRVTFVTFAWALIATILLLRSNTTDPQHDGDSSAMGNSHVPIGWHGGTPSDLFKGSCYCGEDKYCMCTPSLAIDAIIEVHDQQFGSGGMSSYQKEQRFSAGECMKLRGVGGDTGLLHSNFLNTKSAADVRLAANTALRESGRVLQARCWNSTSNTSTLPNEWHSVTRAANRTLSGIRGGKRTRGKSSLLGGDLRYNRSNSTRKGNKALAAGSDKSNGEGDGSKSNVRLVLVFRRDPPAGFAIPGGFVEVGESAEHATVREVLEETNLKLVSMELFRVYSDPLRDARRHTVSVVYRCITIDTSNLKKGDDAKEVRLVPLSEVMQLPLAFDHKQILSDYIAQYHSYMKL